MESAFEMESLISTFKYFIVRLEKWKAKYGVCIWDKAITFNFYYLAEKIESYVILFARQNYYFQFLDVPQLGQKS